MADENIGPRHRGSRAIERMVEFAPSTGGLALWVRHEDLPASMAGPLVSTDGAVIRYAAAFEALPVVEQAGLVAHEVLHVALRHAQRYVELQQLLGDVDLELFNVCADAIVNSALGHLTWLRLPASCVRLDRLLSRTLDLVEPEEKSLLEWDVERLYREIDDRRPLSAGGGNASRATSGAAGTPAAAPRTNRRADGPRAAGARALGGKAPADLVPSAAEAPESIAEAARTWGERLLRAHAGDGAHSMLRALVADLPRARTPWQQVLRTRLNRGLSRQPDVSWSRPARSYLANQGRLASGCRMPWEPGVTASRAVPRLAVIVDVSGSIDDPLLRRFATEIDAITRRVGATIVLVVGDDQVRTVARLEPGRSTLSTIEFDGRGGTDFTPLLEEADRHGPDLGVVLTDLEGPARFRPRWPVVWALPPTHAGARAPFGTVLVLE